MSARFEITKKYASYWHYDTTKELELLNQLWPVVSIKLHFFTPPKKPTGWNTDSKGRYKRVYDTPT